MKITLLTLVVLFNVVAVKAQNKESAKSSSDVSGVAFCDLLRDPTRYDGKEVRFRAIYLADFELAAFHSDSCSDKKNRTWAEFDQVAIAKSSRPEILEKLKEQVYCCLWGGDNYWRETDMLLTGVFHSSREDYGHLGQYRFMIIVKSVEEISATKKTKWPGFDPHE